MSITLVVVDMQPTFPASGLPNVIVGVTKELIQAKQNNWPVVFVEYKFEGEARKATMASLLNVLRGYKQKARITKTTDDGSREILRAIYRRNFPSSYLRVCGVNTNACVWATVEGLLSKTRHTKIEVVKEACGTSLKKPFTWRQYFRHPNLRLV